MLFMIIFGKMEKMMTELDRERIKLATDVLHQIANELELTRSQAKSFVRGIQNSWNVRTLKWEETESQKQLSDARRLLNAAKIFHDIEDDKSENATKSVQCYIRAGELFEWLFRANDKIETVIPLQLLASASYQLGRLPAMASVLLLNLPSDQLGIRIFAQFLSADFDQVVNSVGFFWHDNLDYCDREASYRIFHEDSDDNISWYITIELIRSLGLISDCLRIGENDRLDRALQNLQALDQYALYTASEDISLLISLLYKVAKSFQNSTVYKPLQQLREINADQKPLLDKYARTLYSQKRGILWTSQLDGINRLLKKSSFALCTPTGSGKTLVANLALVKELLLRPSADHARLALYLVPSRALANEVEARLSDELGKDLGITGLYGGTQWGITDFLLNIEKPTVIIATVEKADALLRYLGTGLLFKFLKLVILDEAHQVVIEDFKQAKNDFAEHSNRALRLESFVSRILVHSPEVERIALTAVAGGAEYPVAKWIEGKIEAKAVSSNYRSMRQIIGVFETKTNSAGSISLELLNGQSLAIIGSEEQPYIHLSTPKMPKILAEASYSLQRFNELNVFWTALNIANKEQRILISIAQEPQRSFRWYKEALEYKSWKDAPGFNLPENDIDRNLFEETREVCIDYCGKDSYELALLEQGVATNHGQMPLPLRRLMTVLIKRGICPITVATSTLTEGVNLPFDLIFVTSLMRRRYDPKTENEIISPMSSAEFRNLSGRAGRAGESNGMAGITLVAIPTNYSTKLKDKLRTQRRELQKMQNNYENMKESLQEDYSKQNEVDSPLASLLNSLMIRLSDNPRFQKVNFINWLEQARPENISDDAGKLDSSEESLLADTLDELDGILLSAVQEIESKNNEEVTELELEQFLAEIWNKTFSKYAKVQEDWLEEAFVCRGCAIVENIYPESDERKRLYHYGYTPFVGKRFSRVENDLKQIIQNSSEYGEEEIVERFEKFLQLGEYLKHDRGYGFRSEKANEWKKILKWWFQIPSAISPEPKELRKWQKFVSEDIDFRFSMAIGAVVAQAWSEGTKGENQVPSLDTWKEFSGLPWFGFWARELLRWGTLDPFVAFSMSKGIANTRSKAVKKRTEFEEWLREYKADVASEDFIDPKHFLMWEHSDIGVEFLDEKDDTIPAELSENDYKSENYRVIPMEYINEINKEIKWLDPAGFLLATSELDEDITDEISFRNDYKLNIDYEEPFVECIFKG